MTHQKLYIKYRAQEQKPRAVAVLESMKRQAIPPPPGSLGVFESAPGVRHFPPTNSNRNNDGGEHARPQIWVTSSSWTNLRVHMGPRACEQGLGAGGGTRRRAGGEAGGARGRRALPLPPCPRPGAPERRRAAGPTVRVVLGAAPAVPGRC